MTSEEVLKKRAACVQNIQQGLTMIEQLKGRVAQERGKLGVYDEILQEMGVDPTSPPAEFPAEGQGEPERPPESEGEGEAQA
jgi:hypothetical protein